MDVNEIGNRIKKARTLRNYTLDDVANEIGVAKSTIQRYENGLINKPKLPVLQAIADSLRVNPAWLSGQDVPMIIDESVSVIVEKRLKEIGMSLEEVAEKSGVSLHWLRNLDTFIPGQWGDYEIGYDWITKVAEVIDLPASQLRTALARQEIPDQEPDDLPRITAKEAFKETLNEDTVKTSISRTEQEHLNRYRYVDDKGKHTVDTVLEMEYNRCKLTNVIPIPQEDKQHLEVKAAHNDKAADPEQQQLMTTDIDDMNNNDKW